MAADIKYPVYQYRVRAGTPMPVGAGSGEFVWHTFFAEKSLVDVYLYTEKLLKSSQFRGQGGDLMSASFSRLPAAGGNAYQGKVVYEPDFVDETSFGDSGGTEGFIECTSLSFNYNIMGIVTISFTIVHDTPGLKTRTRLDSYGGQTFIGFVTNADVTPIPNTVGWYESHVTLMATTAGSGGISFGGG